MSKQVRIPSSILSESFLIGVLYLVGTLSLYEDVIRRGRPYVYPTILMLQLYIIKSWMRIPSNNTLHYYLSIRCNNDRILKVCKIQQIPDRRTIDRRFSVLPIRNVIGTMGNLFVSEGLTGNESASVDSSLLKAACPVWHKSDMKQNRIPVSGIDTDARWGFSKSKGWVWGYKLHLSCSTGSLVVPLSSDVTAANVHDGKQYEKLVESLLGFQNVLCDPAMMIPNCTDTANKEI